MLTVSIRKWFKWKSRQFLNLDKHRSSAFVIDVAIRIRRTETSANCLSFLFWSTSIDEPSMMFVRSRDLEGIVDDLLFGTGELFGLLFGHASKRATRSPQDEINDKRYVIFPWKARPEPLQSFRKEKHASVKPHVTLISLRRATRGRSESALEGDSETSRSWKYQIETHLHYSLRHGSSLNGSE